jgi:outer membrane receptor protein involved in Fe transport
VLFPASAGWTQQGGSIRGTVHDKDYDAPLAMAQVLIVETGARVTGSEDGTFVFSLVPPGSYTLVFSKDGYTRQVKAGVVVQAGRMTEVDAWLPGEFTEMEEVVAQDLPIGGASETGLLRLRLESAALMDSIGSELLSLAGASDAASALQLVAGATVQDGKYAVVRGLPDRYVSSQLNGFRLPTADAEKRAVQLDQFPAAVIESIQVTKTFTPDQQGDASGGAVNVILKGIPDQTTFQISGQWSGNTQVTGRDDFLTCDGCGLNYWGVGRGDRDIPTDGNFDGPMGVTRGEAPIDYKWSLSGGGNHEFDNGIRIGGFAGFFYEADSAFYDNGLDNSLWVETPGAPLSPQYIQGTPAQGDFKTQLFDVTQGTAGIQWAALGTFGIETENHAVNMAYLRTQLTENQATLAEDTRGKEYYFPGHDPDDPDTPGHDELDAAPWLRLETLEYTERVTETYMLQGRHTFDVTESAGDAFRFLPSTIDWGFAYATADLHQPDKTQFGSLWKPEQVIDLPAPFPPIIIPATFYPFKPAANFTLGNLQRIWKDITEQSTQYNVNWTLPFKQWTDDEGYLKVGWFSDHVTRDFAQESFSNFNDNAATFEGDFSEFWSAHWIGETANGEHPITAAEIDVDSDGEQNISAWYAMADFPLVSDLSLIGGVRVETTELNLVNTPEADVTWVPPGASGPVTLNPGDADVAFDQQDVLPAVGFVYEPIEGLTLRGSWAKTVARQTFRELTPIIQQEFLGGPIFIGNPQLEMSEVTNYDLRLDFVPYDGGLYSVSWFYKDVEDPIEYVQRNAGFTFTTPVNFPTGNLDGIELEARQDLGRLWEPLTGLLLGANATFINSEVTLSAEESAGFSLPNIDVPTTTRDMTGAPDYLFNAYLTWESEETGTQVGLFYTLTGDTLVAGATQSNGHFVPDVYATPTDTLNFSVTQKFGKWLKLTVQAKNLTNSPVETVYRPPNGADAVRTYFTEGIEFSVGLSAQFTF